MPGKTVVTPVVVGILDRQRQGVALALLFVQAGRHCPSQSWHC
ncbi:hypothetical protein [Phormidium sp. FACHB-592]|nr:hypothetical protein [Phormidium sp. FACHB-592]